MWEGGSGHFLSPHNAGRCPHAGEADPIHPLPSPPMQAGVPMLVMLATGADDLRKPSTGMWEIMCRDHNGGVKPGEADAGVLAESGWAGGWAGTTMGARDHCKIMHVPMRSPAWGAAIQRSKVSYYLTRCCCLTARPVPALLPASQT